MRGFTNLRGGGLVKLPEMPSKLVLSAFRRHHHYTPTTRGRAVAARVAHNHKVAGSSPAPATKIRTSSNDGVFILVMERGSVLRQRFFLKKNIVVAGSCSERSRADACIEHDPSGYSRARTPRRLTAPLNISRRFGVAKPRTGASSEHG